MLSVRPHPCQLRQAGPCVTSSRPPAPPRSVITKTEWKQAGNETAQTDMSCSLVGDEVAGCFRQDDGSVHSVAVSTYRCTAGNCASFAPGLLGKDEEEQ